MAISIASELLGQDPLKHPDFYLCFPVIKVDKTIATSKNLIEEFKVFFKVDAVMLWNRAAPVGLPAATPDAATEAAPADSATHLEDPEVPDKHKVLLTE